MRRGRGRGRWCRRGLAAAVDRAAVERGDLRAAESALAGRYVDLQEVRERGERVLARAPVADLCPYLGLATYDAEQAEFFCGRERLVAELVARVAGATMLVIVGPRAAASHPRCAPGCSPRWPPARCPAPTAGDASCMRPGERPAEALDRALWKAAGAKRLVVAVDQFDEAFTACRDDAEREAFFDALVAAAAQGTLVVLAVRADFYGRLAAHPGARRADRRQPGARRPAAARRAAARDRAPRAARRPGRRAGARRRAGRRRRRRARRRCRCSRRRSSSSGTSVTGGCCGTVAYERTRRRARRGRPAGRGDLRQLSARRPRRRAESCCGSPTPATRSPSCAAASRSTTSTSTATRTPQRWKRSPSTAS